MNFDEVILKVVEILNQTKIPYFLTGAVAVIYYGEIRTTHDIDLVVAIKEKDIKTIVQNFEQDFFIDEISIKNAMQKQSMFNALHKDDNYKVDFWILSNDDYSRERFLRRVKVTIFNKTMFLPTPEDLIITKLEWFKQTDIDKHYFDVLGIYRIQKENLDKNYITNWCKKKSLLDLWQKIQTEQ